VHQGPIILVLPHSTCIAHPIAILRVLHDDRAIYDPSLTWPAQGMLSPRGFCAPRQHHPCIAPLHLHCPPHCNTTSIARRPSDIRPLPDLACTRYAFTSRLLCTKATSSLYCPTPPALPTPLQYYEYCTTTARYKTRPRLGLHSEKILFNSRLLCTNQSTLNCPTPPALPTPLQYYEYCTTTARYKTPP